MSDNGVDKNRILFLGLVQSLSASVWAHLGKQQNPLTGKIERNLREASFTIDLLEMLSAKTEGNLEADERRILENTIAELKLNYVDEKLKAEKKAREQPGQPSEEPTEPPPPDAAKSEN
jgi:hypothetical protein